MNKKKLVVLTGAGISAESGLKTFRDSDGLWEGYDLMEVATPGAWKKNPGLVLDFYNMRRRDVLAAQPNPAHFGLAVLEKDYEVYIITQNIDDLHERAGSTNILHLHGEILKMRSEKNKSFVCEIKTDISLGQTAEDGCQYRPDIVWFEEPVPMIINALKLVQTADIFAVIGTSLVVYPAAELINYVGDNIPKFIIDKKIPDITAIQNLVAIEKPASSGIKDFTDALRLIR
jgi:NAD-dependent deacetylase